MEENSQQPPAATAEAQAPLQSVAPHRGVLILILGILGIVCCFICGIIAWVMGNNDLREIDAGRICGMVSVIIPIAVICLWLLMAIFIGAGAALSR